MSTRVCVCVCVCVCACVYIRVYVCVCWAMRGKISSVCYHLLSASLLGVIRWGTACYGRAYCRLHVRRSCVFVLLSAVRLSRHTAG